MTRASKKEAGFGIIEIIIILCIVAATVFTGWYIWNENKKSSTESGERRSSPAQIDDQSFVGAENQGGQILLKISQWGVEIPLNGSNKDLMYRYAKNDTNEAVSFTFKSLQDKNICKTDVGVSLTRKKTENEPPFNTDNPQAFKKLGTYYYYVAQSSAPCYDPDNPVEVAAVKQAAGDGNIRQPVVDSLKDLRITDN